MDDDHGIPTPRTSLRLRCEEDLLALIPVTLGFHPHGSVVLVTLDRSRGMFSARCDLADEVADVAHVVDTLVSAALNNGAELAFVVVYTADEALARKHLRLLTRELEARRVPVAMRLRVTGARWYPLLPRRSTDPLRFGVPFDISSHEFVLRSVFQGDVLLQDRSELAASLGLRDDDEAAAVAATYGELDPLSQQRSARVAEGEWLHRLLQAEEEPWEPGVCARVLRAVGETEIRDVALCVVRRENAARHVRSWRRLVTLCPEQAVAPVAALLAFSAWMSGDGALAWCAVDRSLTADPRQTLAVLVGQALHNAFPPSRWEPMDAADIPLFAG